MFKHEIINDIDNFYKKIFENNTCIEQILESIKELTSGSMLSGAGGIKRQSR